MRFYSSGIPNGDYEVLANLYTVSNMRYFYGYSPSAPKQFHVDTVGGSGGSTEFAEYSLGRITVSDGTFNLYVQDADPLPGYSYPYFGWAWIVLEPVNSLPTESHYITARHNPADSISTGSMNIAGIQSSNGATAIAYADYYPFLVVTNAMSGRAVQWGSYEWMKLSVKGPVFGLDDLVWRSMVWAARKPFVMQGLPNFVTMRIDDTSGPFNMVQIANEFGMKPWLGVFLRDMSSADSAQLSSLVNSGNATASIHAYTNDNFFYYDHVAKQNFSDTELAAHFEEGKNWHIAYNIPISKFVAAHYYEMGSNAFSGLFNWGVEYVGTQMVPGNPYDGSTWLRGGPYRLFEVPQSARNTLPGTYSDFLQIPGHPEFDGDFFNCITEIRDDAGYEWYPSNDVQGSIGRGTRQVKRALDSMVLATLFTHQQHIAEISDSNWREILRGVDNNVSSYKPIYVTMDYACQYLRAMKTTSIQSGEYDPVLNMVTTRLIGDSDIPTQFYLFTEKEGVILDTMVNTPIFSNSTVVTYSMGVTPTLARVVVSPGSVNLPVGGSQAFTATGYDTNGNVMSGLAFTWSASAGGTITQQGVFTAGTVPGIYSNNVAATSSGISGYASVTVTAPILASIVVSPRRVNLQVGGSQAFTATGYDTNGNVMSGLAFTWSATAGGTITQQGVFTAGTVPGNYNNNVTATSSGIFGYASVKVRSIK
jgi:hypothetical protein